MTRGLTEADVEDTALHWLRGLGWQVKYGPDLAFGMPEAERSDPGYRDVILEGRLRDALARLNPALPAEALADAQRKLLRLDAPSLIERNHAMHRLLVDGVTVEYRGADGGIRGAQARVIDLTRPRTTTSSRSTSSPWSSSASSAAPTWCCSSTACRWW